MPFLKSLKLDGILSFPPGSEAIPLTPLNVLIGPNGSGKSNLIEGIELLRALPTGFASAIRAGGGVREWLWKGENPASVGRVEASLDRASLSQRLNGGLREGEPPGLDYKLAFAALEQRFELTEEVVEDEFPPSGKSDDLRSYYRLQGGDSVVNGRRNGELRASPVLGSNLSMLGEIFKDGRHLDRKSLRSDESILMQLKDPFVYPELTELGLKFGQIQTFREWTIGRDAEVRKPQPTDLPADFLLPDSRNLGLILNQLEHSAAWSEFNGYLSRFLPRFQRFSTRIEGGTVQFYLHEDGMKAPIPATRLSDGTIRFMAILAQLLSPTPPPLICMEEPELGLHPDAIALLASLLQEASTRTQLIVTTHSDILISALTEVADSVLVCEYRNGTVMQRVESSQLRFWLDKYTLGEIWRIGEIGGNL